ncbi:DUF4167 domain-containing protein [Mesobacterium pallidum]|uniref:DUF4167 domain-containing protein n=1 Tax=Mesobacterium pallidum TaxID=2872037 RepID=UPI001EE38611|nr:DUF4167 domain-containing protein [Mesobacterium pallidum]
MRSSKSRSRSKSNRNRQSTGANVINRVFDSSGPEGKVRGTPQQIIDKYNQLARDAQLANDRVATENFQQHAEHYLRLLSEAQREIDAKREEQERQNRERQAERDRDRSDRNDRQDNASQPEGGQPQRSRGRQDKSRDDEQVNDPAAQDQPDVLDLGASDSSDDSGLVETPENKAEAKAREDEPVFVSEEPPAKKPRARRTTPRKKAAPKTEEAAAPASSGDAPEAAE